MESQLYTNDALSPRTLTLCTGCPRTPSLTIRRQSSSTESTVPISITLTPNSSVKAFPKQQINGILGILSAFGDEFLGVITKCSLIGYIECFSVWQINSVAFYSLSSDRFDKYWRTSFSSNSMPGHFPDPQSQQETDSLLLHPCHELAKYLSSGSFYFSYEVDLSLPLGQSVGSSGGSEGFWEDFAWNANMLRPFCEVIGEFSIPEQLSLLCTRVIKGFVAIRAHVDCTLGLLSKISCKRAGTRFQSRGTDDDGNVSNFVYSEVFFQPPNCNIFSFGMLRGTVPVFWDQPGMQLVQHKIQIVRTAAATQPAFEKHFERILGVFEGAFIIDLLSTVQTSDECMLSRRFREHISTLSKKLAPNKLHYTSFDFNALCKSDKRQLYRLLEDISEHLQCSYTYNSKPEVKQQIIFRVNCLDCLDRTNVVQAALAKKIISNFCRKYKIHISHDALESELSSIWADNGDALSNIYAGTKALKSSLLRTGKVGLMSVLKDITKSTQRFFVNNFQDKEKQQTIDLLLGKCPGQLQPVLWNAEQETLTKALESRRSEWETIRQISLYTVTWNVATIDPEPNSFALTALFAPLVQNATVPDVIVVCLQEVVELSSMVEVFSMQNNSCPSLLRWQTALNSAIDRAFLTGHSLEPLTCNQLVGIAIFIWVKRSLSCSSSLKNLSSCSKKTGWSGMAGNKGAVLVRFDLFSSSCCFVGSHFAAGQESIEERNSDFAAIAQEATFSHAKKIHNHENIFWLGDLNYRLNADKAGGIDSILTAIIRKRFSSLWPFDQLRLAMRENKVFPGAYKEGSLEFAPTYKFERFSDSYCVDGEAERVPSWTDRIIWSGPSEQKIYSSVPSVMASDHRPVIALFEMPVKVENDEVKQSIVKALTESQELLAFQEPQENLIEF